MPDYWEYPSVSMGLGAMTAIRQAVNAIFTIDWWIPLRAPLGISWETENR